MSVLPQHAQNQEPNTPIIASVVGLVQTGQLAARHVELLRARAISDEVILERSYRTYAGPTLLLELEKRLSSTQRSPKHYPVLAYPTFSCGGEKPVAYVLRPDNPRKTTTSTGQERVRKYEYPRGAPQVLDVLPSRAGLLGDPKADMWFAEGTLKADSLTSAGAPVAASINGVYGFRGSNDKGGKLIIPDFENVALNGRRVILAFDSDMTRNANVMQAARRLGGWLSTKGATVKVLMLPQVGDNKVGVDDFLASLDPSERTIRALEPYIVPLEDGTLTFTDRFGRTPEGAELLNPPGYQNRQGPLTYTNPQTGVTKSIYGGYIAVIARGRDRATGEATLTVAWRDGEADAGARTLSVTAPQAKLASARGLIEVLGAKGAAVHDNNAKPLSEFLIEFARVNNNALETKVTTNRYGYTGDGVVGPGWSVGEAAEYNGQSVIKIKPDGADEYRRAVRAAAEWGATPLLLALGLAAVSPFLERAGTVRNPIMWASGDSNHGKSTLGEFAVGLYGDPRALSIQSGRSTWAGFTQRLDYLGGFPAIFDEAQTADAAKLQNVVYQHANGQTYAKGGADGQPLGNNLLHGAVFVLGETPPQLTFKGAQNRILDIRVTQHLPLGIGPADKPAAGSLNGAQRADLLRRAVEVGAGSLGERLAHHIWHDWSAFAERIDRHQAGVGNVQATEWVRPLAAAAAGLDVLLDLCKVPFESRPTGIASWAQDVLCATRAENDIARVAFEALQALVSNASPDLHCDGVLVVRGERVAYKSVNEWQVLHRSDAVKKVLEPFGGLQGLGAQWARRGWIRSDKEGKSTPRRTILGTTQRVVVIDDKIMRDGLDDV